VRSRDHGGKPPFLRKPGACKGPSPLESHLNQDEIIPLAVETAFARSFVERFGAETEEAVKAFMGEIRNLCHLAEAKKDCFLDSPVAREMGTQYPFIQGAMSWITDVRSLPQGLPMPVDCPPSHLA